MRKKRTQNTRGKIIEAAWRLFYRQGYDDTTVEEIIEESGTSRGSFYHYFQGKDDLLSTLADVFDQKYEALIEAMNPEMDRFDQLMYLNQELFAMLENSISLDLVARLYSAGDSGGQVPHGPQSHLLSPVAADRPTRSGTRRSARRCHR